MWVVSIPMMVLGMAVAVTPVLWWTLREHRQGRRLRADAAVLAAGASSPAGSLAVAVRSARAA
jgi:hypothetical protein